MLLDVVFDLGDDGVVSAPSARRYSQKSWPTIFWDGSPAARAKRSETRSISPSRSNSHSQSLEFSSNSFRSRLMMSFCSRMRWSTTSRCTKLRVRRVVMTGITIT